MASLLKVQLELLHTLFIEKVTDEELNLSSMTMHDIIECIKTLSTVQRSMIYEVITIVDLLLVMPASNAMSERSFSALQRIKSYLRLTMTQQRLNSLMILHVHKDRQILLILTMLQMNLLIGRKLGLVNLMSNLYLCMYVASILYLFSF